MDPKQHFWSNFDHLRMANIENNKQKCRKKIKALSSLTFRENIRLLFAIFGLLLPGNMVGSQVKGLESKFNKSYFIHTIPGQLPVKKFWFQHFPVLWL